ncbi:MAG: bifunctional DNA-formamidopyrimidine glycosylase/DNA-(apurinic or apyrimidinic site) lyase [Actinobacteria bacterium]|nr:bifunctional DNA-formamidopyrimidine glycosylase/DNA-(apurinic or apyrimidinic site) lyase [Actinomycetota bacterium]
MPELPEVETVRRGLASLVVGYRIAGVEELHPRVRKPSSIAPLTAITGATVVEINRRGKFLWFVLDGPQVLVAHLGMSGQFLLTLDDRPAPRHPRAAFQMRKGRKREELIFNDQRTFGWLSVESTVDGIPTSALHIAKDPFDSGFVQSDAVNEYARRNMKIKSALLNQEIMSGVGNIYADETLWRARVHPETITRDLSKRKINLIIESAIEVMSEAVGKGGTSFDDLYVNINGESGFFEQSLSAYARTDQPCERCGTPIKRILVGQRSSHFCPRCQRKP